MMSSSKEKPPPKCSTTKNKKMKSFFQPITDIIKNAKSTDQSFQEILDMDNEQQVIFIGAN